VDASCCEHHFSACLHADSLLLVDFFCVPLETNREIARGRNYFLNGMKKRLVASHRMNQSSSRSHCIFTLYVEQQHALFPAKIVHSKLSLVDLYDTRSSSTRGTATAGIRDGGCAAWRGWRCGRSSDCALTALPSAWLAAPLHVCFLVPARSAWL